MRRGRRLLGRLFCRTFVTVIAGIMVLVASIGGHSLAAENDPDLEARYEAAFQETLKDPSNLEKLFRFAELAAQYGDVEGAISALERMLLYNPELPRIRLELGVLYFRLGSYQIARSYFVESVEGDDVPEEVRQRAGVYLAEVDKRLSRHQFAGSVMGGLRYQSNANAGPSSTAVRALGIPATLGDQFTGTSDVNVFLAGTLRHAFDFRTQGGEVWLSEALAYGSRQRDQHDLDLGVLELKTGPSGQIDLESFGVYRYRPYVVGSVITLEDKRYIHTYGGGLTLSTTVRDKLGIQFDYEHRRQSFKPNGTRPTAGEQSGEVDKAELTLSLKVTPVATIGVQGFYGNESAKAQKHGNHDVGITGFVSLTYDAPWKLPGRWISTFSGGYSRQRYKEVDSLVDPTIRREDQERRFLFVQTIPINETFSVIGTAQRVVVESTLPNYEYNNTILTIGLNYRF